MPAARRAAVTAAQATHRVSERRACRVIGADRRAHSHRRRRADDQAAPQQGGRPGTRGGPWGGFLYRGRERKGSILAPRHAKGAIFLHLMH
jgi:hypothetical protein